MKIKKRNDKFYVVNEVTRTKLAKFDNKQDAVKFVRKNTNYSIIKEDSKDLDIRMNMLAWEIMKEKSPVVDLDEISRPSYVFEVQKHINTIEFDPSILKKVI